ncbi:uncharacterized protein LOC107804045 isoform X1 [Nicotiana tabacum]|uniref:Uncharacterized protein LOC107804045 isoform X1 n=1 Tax=Nicotiana tabacum TaxID=4097 RepID=A0A1S4B3B8_TOBAC|nr:PREDICTED: uncharacterized protein LOC107804045 [Nicotiana tabacum]
MRAGVGGQRVKKAKEMGEESSKPNDFYTKDTIISEELSEEAASFVDHIFRHVSLNAPNFPPQHDAKDSFSELTRGCLKVHSIHPGKVSCILSVKPAISNVYQSMHGGAVGAVAERVSIACARTVVGKDKELFLGELSMSYVSAAPSNNVYGGAVGAVAERVSIACATTVVGKDKELFLGELSMPYVSAAPSNAEVVVDGSVIRSGRNLTAVAVDFRLKDSGKLVYASNATFYHMPVANL